MSRFVRSSKYRHVFCNPPKKDNIYGDLKPTKSAWDSNTVEANPYFWASLWASGGGGAFIVWKHEKFGKVGATAPLYEGHKGAVLDLKFNPFNDFLIASASEDCFIKIWGIPKEGPVASTVDSLVTLKGHGRKVGHLEFHPTAANVLASDSTDLSVRFWDIEKGQEKLKLEGHTNNINSLSFNYDGSMLLTTGKDKKMMLWDPRAQTKAAECENHEGIKGSRAVWLGETHRLFTTGFSKTSQREIALWDSRNLGPEIARVTIDASSGILMPFYDNDTGVLFLAGKGDGNIRYYEFTDEAPFINYLSEYKSSDPQRGMAMMSKRAVSVTDVEIARLFKLTTTELQPLSFRVPRKAESFADDIFPDTASGEPALTADEWLGGANAPPKKISLRDGFVVVEATFVSSAVDAPDAPAHTPTAAAHAAAPDAHLTKEIADLKKENAELKRDNAELKHDKADLENHKSDADNRVAELEVRVRELEQQLAAAQSGAPGGGEVFAMETPGEPSEPEPEA
jgi:hypothetical protein